MKGNVIVTLIASILFFIAFAASIFAIFGSVAQSMPRILEVIENRHVTERQARKITMDTMRTVKSLPIACAEINRKPLALVTMERSLPSQIRHNEYQLPMAA